MPLCIAEAETELHIMAHCEVIRILWFRLLGLHLRNIVFTNPLDFLATITRQHQVGSCEWLGEPEQDYDYYYYYFEVHVGSKM